MKELDYWKDCIAEAAAACDLPLTTGQLECLAEGAKGGHECYGMAFYSPPASERLAVIEDGWKTKYAKLEIEFEKYRGNAETAVKQALRQHGDAIVSIGEYGQVTRHDGRSTVIQ